MEVYETEEQQVEAIKSWWKENGKAVVLGAVIGLGGLYGWRYYQGEIQSAKEQASEAYTQAMNTLDSGSENAIAEVKAFIAANEPSGEKILFINLTPDIASGPNSKTLQSPAMLL